MFWATEEEEEDQPSCTLETFLSSYSTSAVATDDVVGVMSFFQLLLQLCSSFQLFCLSPSNTHSCMMTLINYNQKQMRSMKRLFHSACNCFMGCGWGSEEERCSATYCGPFCGKYNSFIWSSLCTLTLVASGTRSSVQSF